MCKLVGGLGHPLISVHLTSECGSDTALSGCLTKLCPVLPPSAAGYSESLVQ